MKPSELLQDAAGRWARVTPRERKMLAVLALAALITAPIKAFDLLQAAQTRNMEARAAQDQALAASRAARGGGLTGQLAREREQVRVWSWQAASAPIGRVMVQDRLIALAANAGMAGAEIKAAEKIEQAGAVALVRIDVSAPFAWPSFAAFLQGLSDTGKGFVVDSLVVQDGDKPRIKIVLKMPVIVEKAAVS